MKSDKLNPPNIFEIASLRFKAIVAEAGENQGVIVTVPLDAGINGLIVLLQPALPSIH